MLRDFFIKLQSVFVDSDEIDAFRSMLPKKVRVQYRVDGEDYIAFIDSVDGEKIKGLLITQGKSSDELVNNLNQLIYSNANIPERIRPHYGRLFSFPIKNSLKKSGKLVLVKA